MTSLLMLLVLCYIYSILIVAFISYVVVRDGVSLTFLFGLPLVITLLVFFFGGVDTLRAVAFFPIRTLAGLRLG
ncbi:MAG: hypothetical protein KBG20_11065 [Caldilineaceae bacterium]|nr:hypothetical protein [Caldilineaceae bacterium]MBP8108040.1 hypothetical protein [Caldilineaceae bacterium]MBP8124767.1 hypothetical protein [Caldilineaceae bacterium]MBP9072835.1 hypothetical protein [Caldilineaceae bacterium]